MPPDAEERGAGEPPVAQRRARIRFVPSADLPDQVPPELYAQIDLAARRVLELAAQDRELHFVEGEIGMVVEVRDLDGNVLRVISTAEALEVISGAELP